MLTPSSRRRKIGNDPNNTTWANDTEAYGHRMLMSQGWTPGGFLGVTDAAHAAHYTAANSSHIRVLLKEDTLGLGAQRGKAEGQNFGLIGFNDLLGRLNGKDEAVIQQEQQKRIEIGNKLYAHQRWGGTRFVSGGFLVGEKIERQIPAEHGVVEINMGHVEDGTNVRETEEKDVNVVNNVVEHAKQKAKKQKEKQEKEASKHKKTDRKASKKHKSDKESGSDSNVEQHGEEVGGSESRKETKEERQQRRAERRARKEEKRLKKAQKSGGTIEAEGIQDTISSQVTSGVSTPATGVSTPLNNNRVNVRQRYIKQKRMAMMDPQALREVCSS